MPDLQVSNECGFALCTTHRDRSRDNPKIQILEGRRAGWYTGGNSSCRRHIASMHYPLYVKRCKEGGIRETEQATPKKIWAARLAKEKEKTKNAEKGAQLQLTLDGVVQKVETPTAFSWTAILDAVTQHVVCGDQVRDTPSSLTVCLVPSRSSLHRLSLPIVITGRLSLWQTTPRSPTVWSSCVPRRPKKSFPLARLFRRTSRTSLCSSSKAFAATLLQHRGTSQSTMTSGPRTTAARHTSASQPSGSM